MSEQLLLERFDLVIDNPENIQLLRRYIVDLAVRGKLLEKTALDITASEMLNRIKEKTNALVKQGKLKKQKPMTSIDTEEVPATYIAHCTFERLGNVANLQKGLTGIKSAIQGEFPLVVTATARSTCNHYDFDGPAAIIPMVSSTGHGHASLNRLHYQEGKFALGTILCAVIPIDEELISARFLFEYLTAFKEELLVSKMNGTANVTLTISKIAEVPVPIIAPLVQQRVDELMALCDQLEAAKNKREQSRDQLVAASLHSINPPADDKAANTPEALREQARFIFNNLPRLTTRPEHIKQLHQTILNLAVRGKLVAQDPNDESATELLKQIKAEKALLVNQGARKKEVVLPDVDFEQAPFALPLGWSWARFPELGTFGRGKSKHRPRNDSVLFDGGTHLLIQTGDVARSQGVVKTYTNKYNDIGLAQSMKWPAGTLCITIAANIADTGILSFDACFPDSVVGFIPVSMFQNARYFEYFLRTAKANLLEFAPATAQKNINLEILNAVLIPLPPLAEQQRIVAKVDELMALCDQLEAQLITTQTDSRRLLEAVLHEALAPALEEIT
ncbi:MAG: restriction endonuclease subunit S [Methylococcaceae bacterium]